MSTPQSDRLSRLAEIKQRAAARPLWDDGDGEESLPLSSEPAEEDCEEFSYEDDVVPADSYGASGEMTAAAQRTEKAEKNAPSGKRADSELTDRCRRAIDSAMNILAYADNTERRLREKLARKKFSPDEIDTAVRYVSDHGYLDEERMLLRAAEHLAQSKLYGRNRICVELINKGFTRDKITSLDFAEFDFPALCASRIRASLGMDGDETDLDLRLDDKTKASLMRAGFSYSDIRTAEQMLRGE